MGNYYTPSAYKTVYIVKGKKYKSTQDIADDFKIPISQIIQALKKGSMRDGTIIRKTTITQ